MADDEVDLIIVKTAFTPFVLMSVNNICRRVEFVVSRDLAADVLVDTSAFTTPGASRVMGDIRIGKPYGWTPVC